MKILYSILFVSIFAIIGAGSAWKFTQNTIQIQSFETTLFMTVVSSDNDSSVEEKETASHFFAEAVLGWTLSPAFVKDLGFPLFSRKQERANIVFQITGTSTEELKKMEHKFTAQLEKKLARYNKLAKTRFALLLDNPTREEKIAKKSFWTMGGGIAGFFIGLFLLEGWRFWRREK